MWCQQLILNRMGGKSGGWYVLCKEGGASVGKGGGAAFWPLEGGG